MAAWSWSDAYRLWKEFPSIEETAEKIRQSGNLDERKYAEVRYWINLWRLVVVLVTIPLVCLTLVFDYFAITADYSDIDFFLNTFFMNIAIVLFLLLIWRWWFLDSKLNFYLFNLGDVHMTKLLPRSKWRRYEFIIRGQRHVVNFFGSSQNIVDGHSVIVRDSPEYRCFIAQAGRWEEGYSVLKERKMGA